MQNISHRVQFQKLFIVAVCLSILSGSFSPLAAQTRRAANVKKAPTKPASTVTPTPPALNENNSLSSESKSALSAAWTSGERLPPPMSLPGGNPDEIAANPARKVAAKSDEGKPASERSESKVRSRKSKVRKKSNLSEHRINLKKSVVEKRKSTRNSQPSDFGLNTIDTPEEQKKIPCRMDGNAPTVMDAGATISGEAYGKIPELLEELYEDLPAEKAIQKFAMFYAVANIVLAYAKFVRTYAALETKIVMEGAPPLVRTRNAKPGDSRPLRAKVRMNIGTWQMYNCIRMVMNVAVGIDFATLNDGPLGGVGVT